MNIVIAVQARTSSTRLPDKVLLPLLDKPLLVRMIERITKSTLAKKIVVATSTQEEDDRIADLCRIEEINCYRGNLHDLLDRHYQLALQYNADAIVKIPSDCPLIDPEIIDRVISHYVNNFPTYDYVSNLHPASYPDGNDVEIMSFQTLEKAWKESNRNFEREHTTPYIWENPDKFVIGNVIWETGFDYSTSQRWTIDYEQDYQFIRNVFNELYPVNPQFGLNDILQLIERKPEITQVNSQYLGNYWYLNHLDDLHTITDYKNKMKNLDH